MTKYYTVTDMKEDKVITTAIQNTTLERIIACTYKFKEVARAVVIGNTTVIEYADGGTRSIRETTEDDMKELVGCY